MAITLARLVRVLVVGALAANALVHLRLAGQYQLGQSAGIGTGGMFRIAAGAAIVAGLFVLLRGTRASYAVALAVSASTLAAVVLYRYVDVPAFGPIPSMYEPIWFLEKTLSAVAEAIGVVFAAIGLLITQRARTTAAHRGPPRPASPRM